MQKPFAARYHSFEKHHWWFRARRLILRDQLSRLAWPPEPRILEVGTGPGENLYTLYPADAVLAGVEPDPDLAALAQARGPVPVYEAPAEHLPDTLPDAAFDAVTLFDVLEHTEDDRAVLQHIKAKLKPGGYLIVSVPAFMLLWGQQDVVSRHYRRYTRKEVVGRLREAGFSVQRATYFNTLLFPPIALFRILHRLLKRSAASSDTDMKYSLGPLDRLLYALFAAEKWLLRVTSLPVGVSVLVVARKPGSTPIQPA